MSENVIWYAVIYSCVVNYYILYLVAIYSDSDSDRYLVAIYSGHKQEIKKEYGGLL